MKKNIQQKLEKFSNTWNSKQHV